MKDIKEPDITKISCTEKMDERELRFRCVEQAVKSPIFIEDETSIVEICEKIYRFVTAKDKDYETD